MPTIQEIQTRRSAAGIPAIALAARARINRSRLSYLERGHVQPTDDELRRLEAVLLDMIQMKSAALLAVGASVPASAAA